VATRLRCDRLTEEELRAALEAADLHLIDWLTDERTWFMARKS
jgi:uncharacterized SAM-dependent methyltransferase